jgi:SAM-dependent methyltransferase
MTQNIYDDETFFAGYSRLPRSLHGLEGAPEWPALRALLPDLQDLRVLDLGCGFGWFCRFAREHGAATVLGIDVSERMLARARRETSDAAITYRQADLERLDLAPGSADLAYSSLAFHYIVDFAGLVERVCAALVPGGNLVFSVEHPMMTAPASPGWAVGVDGARAWPVTGYLDEGSRSTDWLAKGVIKQHRTLATTLNQLLKAGFTVSHIDEWGPTPQQIAAQPSLADERLRPPFLLVAAKRAPYPGSAVSTSRAQNDAPIGIASSLKS